MKKIGTFLIVLLLCCVCSTKANAATTSPGDIASNDYLTLAAAHSYYVGTLGQPCRQCGIPAKWWAQSGDYGFGIYAHGEFNGCFWIMMEDTHWLVVNGTGNTGNWQYGDSSLKSKFSQEYINKAYGVHPWSGLEDFPTQVIHGEGLGDIGKGTYSNLHNVSSFYWGGNGCQEIDDYAFYDMNNLQSIVIDDNVVSINNYAFGLNPILENINFSASLQHIGIRAFQNTAIKECIFPVKLKRIEKAAFSGCSKMKNIKWGKARCKVGKYAFNNCYGLGYRNVKYIPKYIEYQKTSFRNCYGVN